jgi:hypothetical protein
MLRPAAVAERPKRREHPPRISSATLTEASAYSPLFGSRMPRGERRIRSHSHRPSQEGFAMEEHPGAAPGQQGMEAQLRIVCTSNP